MRWGSGCFAFGLLAVAPALFAQGVSYREEASNVGRPGKYHVKVKYPLLLTTDPAAKSLAALASREIKLEADRQRRQFLKENGAGPPPDSAAPEYFLELDFQNGILRPRLISVLLVTHVYTGGAHGNTAYAYMNFGMVAGKPVRLKLAHLFRTRINARSLISSMVIERLKNRPEALYVRDGGVKALSAKQAEQFRVTARGLEFTFAPYEMAPYAAGPIVCSLSWAELKAYLDPGGPLKGLL